MSWIVGLVALVVAALPARAAVERAEPTLAEIVTVKGEEEAQLVGTAAWIEAALRQRLAEGDTLRTGRYGGLSLRFDDRTLIRMHAESLLAIRTLAPASTVLDVQRGSLWGRSTVPRAGLRFETPAVSAAVRGTDYYITVAGDGTTRIAVLDGAIDVSNPFGAVTVRTGEAAIARPGEPPRKEFLIERSDRRRWVLRIETGWLELLSITGRTASDIRADLPASGLDRAEALFDLGDVVAAQAAIDAAEAGLSGGPRFAQTSGPLALTDPPRDSDLVRGMIAVRLQRLDAAEAYLTRAAQLPGPRGEKARLAHAGLLIERGEVARAAPMIEASAASSDEAELLAIWLIAFAGDFEAARERLAAFRGTGRAAVRGRILAGIVETLEGRDERAGEIFRAIYAEEPKDWLAPHWIAIHAASVDLDFDRSVAASREAIAANPSASDAYHNLAIFEFARGHYRVAREAWHKALDILPMSPYPRSGLASAYVADGMLGRAEALVDPYAEESHPDVLAAQARILLARGETAAAVAAAERALVADPGRPETGTNAAVAYHAAREFAASLKALDDAVRIDPNDSDALLIRSVIAIENFDAPTAIRAARDVVDRISTRRAGLLLSSVVSNQSGINNVGSAYGAIGLTDWARFYGDLARSPFLANSAYFRRNLLPSAAAASSTLSQGLVLDPFGIAVPNRFTRFVPVNADYLTLAGEAGAVESEPLGAAQLIASGLRVAPRGFAYNVNLRGDRDAGYREESGSGALRLEPIFAFRLGIDDFLLVRNTFASTRQELPGRQSAPLSDDESGTDQAIVDLAWQRRYALDDRLIVRLKTEYARQRFENERPFGEGITPLDFALATSFGLETALDLYDLPLYDGSDLTSLDGGSLADDTATDPLVIVGGLGPFFGLPELGTGLTEDTDLNVIESFENETLSTNLQIKRLKAIGPFDVSTGLEGAYSETEQFTSSTSFTIVGTGLITDGGFTPTIFPYARLSPGAAGDTLLRLADLSAYAVAETELSPTLALDFGGVLTFRRSDTKSRRQAVPGDFEEIDTEILFDPRIGLAFRPVPALWLRLAIEQQSIGPRVDTLIPQGAVGLVASDAAYNTVGELQSVNLRADWEVSPTLYAFAVAEHQDVDDWTETVALTDSLLGAVIAEGAEISRASIGVNQWLGGGWGARAQYTFTEAQATDGERDDRALPFVPRHQASAALTWLSPSRVTAQLRLDYVGERAGGFEEAPELDAYPAVSADLSWVSTDRAYSVQASLTNLLDESYEVAPGYPGAGTGFRLRLERRF